MTSIGRGNVGCRPAALAAVFALNFALQSPARAQAADPISSASVETHGFVSQGYIVTTDNNYLGPSERGSFEFTEAGINFTHAPSDRLRIGLQIFAHELGPLGNYRPRFDWYYLDYRFWDWLGVRTGRTKLPFGLYNEFSDIDVARVPILLPQAVYPVVGREFLLAQTGVEVYGDISLGRAGSLEYRAYGGTIFLDEENVTADIRGFTVPYLYGGRLMWRSPFDDLQVGGSVQRLRLDFDYAPTEDELSRFEEQGRLPPDFDGVISARLPAWLWIASAEYVAGELLIAAEYTRSYTRLETNLVGGCRRRVNEGFYAAAAYRVLPWLTPGVYYSQSRPDACERVGPEKYQHDAALTLRFDVNANWIVKAEGHYMHGTASLDRALNDGARSTLVDDWGVLLLKTTAYF